MKNTTITTEQLEQIRKSVNSLIQAYNKKEELSHESIFVIDEISKSLKQQPTVNHSNPIALLNTISEKVLKAGDNGWGDENGMSITVDLDTQEALENINFNNY